VNIRQKFCLFFIAPVLVMAAACSSATPTPATMAGYWQGENDIVSTIQEHNGEFVVATVYATKLSHSQNLLISSSYSNGVLTWKYCPPAESCVTAETVSFSGDSLIVNWTDEEGGSGQMTLIRVESAPQP